MKDDCPYETESQFRVSIHNILSSDVDKFDFFVAKEAESCLNILNGMKPHPTSLSRLK